MDQLVDVITTFQSAGWPGLAIHLLFVLSGACLAVLLPIALSDVWKGNRMPRGRGGIMGFLVAVFAATSCVMAIYVVPQMRPKLAADASAPVIEGERRAPPAESELCAEAHARIGANVSALDLSELKRRREQVDVRCKSLLIEIDRAIARQISTPDAMQTPLPPTSQSTSPTTQHAPANLDLPVSRPAPPRELDWDVQPQPEVQPVCSLTESMGWIVVVRDQTGFRLSGGGSDRLDVRGALVKNAAIDLPQGAAAQLYSRETPCPAGRNCNASAAVGEGRYYVREVVTGASSRLGTVFHICIGDRP